MLELLNEKLPKHDHSGVEGPVVFARKEIPPQKDDILHPLMRFWNPSRSSPAETPLSPRTWASIRCGPPIHHYSLARPAAHQRRSGHHGLRPGGAMGRPKGAIRQGGPLYRDGCFRMNCHELATEEHYNIPVITVIFDNRTLGMVRQWQNLIYDKRLLPDGPGPGPRLRQAGPGLWTSPATGSPIRRNSPRPSGRLWTGQRPRDRLRHRQGRHGSPPWSTAEPRHQIPAGLSEVQKHEHGQL